MHKEYTSNKRKQFLYIMYNLYFIIFMFANLLDYLHLIVDIINNIIRKLNSGHNLHN